METVKFDSKGNNAPAYSCSKPGDNSGEYVSIEIADAMKAMIIDLQASLRAINTDAILEHTTEMRKLIGI